MTTRSKATGTLAALALISALAATAADITFRPFEESDLPQLYKWVRTPHVAQWWWTDSETYEKFVEDFHPDMHAKNFQTPFMVYVDGKLTGYAQYYQADKMCEECRTAYHNPGAGTIGLDIIIGEADQLGKGYGCLMVQTFVEKIFSETDATRIIADPDPANDAAIRCYQKMGFKQVNIIDAPPPCVKTPSHKMLLLELTQDNWHS